MTPDDIALLEQRLGDPVWRLTSGEIYKIKTADGRGIIPFHPRTEQRALLVELLEAADAIKEKREGWEMIAQKVKLKARRLGFSTTIGVFIADCLGFRKSFTATLIDQTGDDSKKKMNDIVKVALNSLRESWPLKILKENDSELSVDVDVGEETDGNGVSTFYAGTKARGGSNDLLWCSELGVIQHDDPPRADEIISGAFPSARHGIKIIETTWKGGKGGKLYELIEPTLERKANDWSVSFAPWWLDPRNVAPQAPHDAESNAYFASIESRLRSEGITLTDEQRRWWAMERRTQGIFMKRENPTFLDECWTSPVERSIYGRQMDRAQSDGRIGPFPVDGRSPVHTCWDLGGPANTVVWYFQRLPYGVTRFIDVDYGLNLTLVERMSHMAAKGYVYGKHYFPHDARQTQRTGRTFEQDAAEAGLRNIVVVPQTNDVWQGINYVSELFPTLEFRSPSCDKGIDGLKAYEKAPDTSSGVIRDAPLHTWASHIADALRTFAEADKHGLVDRHGSTGMPAGVKIMAGYRGGSMPREEQRVTIRR